MNYNEESLKLHEKFQGKLNVEPVVPVANKDDLSLVYTPGVAQPCRVIAEDVSRAHDLTIKGRSVAVVSDGSAVLGLGNIGPEAAMPVMEGKALLFKKFGNIDAYPICLATQDVDEIVETVKRIAPGFGGINLEDISAPRCFEIEQRLIEELDIPVFHDDQHGTAIVMLAALINALNVTGKTLEEIRVVITGAGAAGMAVANMLHTAGVGSMAMIDSRGIIAVGRERMNPYKTALAEKINPDGTTGSLADAVKGADVFIGVSGQPGILTKEMVETMNADPIVFAMSNPTPELLPEVAKEAGVAVMATGRSDFPNQVNNASIFPGLFKGLLAGRIRFITTEMNIAAAHALAGCIENPTADQILPSALDETVPDVIAAAVQEAAK